MSDGAGAAGPALAEVRQAALGLLAGGRQEEAFEYLLAALAAVLRKSRELELLVARPRRAGASCPVDLWPVARPERRRHRPPVAS